MAILAAEVASYLVTALPYSSSVGYLSVGKILVVAARKVRGQFFVVAAEYY